MKNHYMSFRRVKFTESRWDAEVRINLRPFSHDGKKYRQDKTIYGNILVCLYK